MYNQHTLPRFGLRLRRTVDDTKVLARSPGGEGDQPTRKRLCASYVYFCCTPTFYFNLQLPNVRVRDCAHAHSTSSVASAGTVVHLGISNFAASSRTPVRCRCVSAYESVPFPLSSGTLALVRRRTHPRDLEPLYLPTLTSPFLSGSVLPTTDTSRCLGINLLALGVYTTVRTHFTREITPELRKLRSELKDRTAESVKSNLDILSTRGYIYTYFFLYWEAIVS